VIGENIVELERSRIPNPNFVIPATDGELISIGGKRRHSGIGRSNQHSNGTLRSDIPQPCERLMKVH
jgi:hypothetical protein